MEFFCWLYIEQQATNTYDRILKQSVLHKKYSGLVIYLLTLIKQNIVATANTQMLFDHLNKHIFHLIKIACW